LTSSTCFETGGSSLVRRFYMQVWRSVFYMHQYRQSSWLKSELSIKHSLKPSRLFSLVPVKHTIPYLYVQPSDWRWTLKFETSRRNWKL